MFRRSFLILLLIIIPFFACSTIEFEEAPSYQVEELPVVSDDNGWDIPANEGIRNALLNADQLVSIRYTPLAEIYKVGGTYSAGKTLNGLLYSSTRAEDLFVPNNVSLWTFMSALQDPYSYLYTVDISVPPYNIRGLAKPFYGQVCTSFVQYVFGIKYNFQIHQMTVWDGFDRVEPQDIEKLRLGDVLTTEKGHTRLVTGIHRDNGKVVEIAISEGQTPLARRRVYSVDDITDSFENGYVFYRYRYINETVHTPSPFVSVGGEEPVDYSGLFAEEIMPRRGDKANWRESEPVIIDVLKKKSFTDYKLFKDDHLIQEKTIPNNSVINLGVMPYGDYKLCLTNGNEDSRFVYWIVADYSIDAHAIGHGRVVVYFSSKNAFPAWTTWRIPANSGSNYNDGPKWTTVITETDAQNGYVVTEMDSYLKKTEGLGNWDFKVAFETKYGVIYSDAKTVYVR